MADIVYYQDILDKLNERFGIDERELSEICKKSIDYIYVLMKNPEVISISLPNLGTMYFNNKRARYSYKNGDTFRNHVDLLEAQILKTSKLKESHKDLAHTRNSYYSIIKKYFFPDRETRKKTRKKEVYTKLEKKQNSI